MRIKLRIFALSLLLLPLSAHAELKTDKAAGNCIGYLATQKNEHAMQAALSMADNQERAMQAARAWIKNAAKYKNEKSTLDGLVYSASSDCRKIGIRPADY